MNMTTAELPPEDLEAGSILSHIPSMIRQRKWLLIIPAIITTLIGTALAFLLPAVYRSEAVLLVESPQLPEEITGKTDPDLVDSRIAKVRQQVLSRPGLIELINKNELYVNERKSQPLSQVIEKMRDSVRVEPKTAEIQQKSAGTSSTIAFSMSFDYSDPNKAQAVAQDLTSQILMIDSTKTIEASTNTVQFLTEQATNLQSQMAELEGQISAIKTANGQVLSNQGGIMMGPQTGAYDAQIMGLQRDIASLRAQKVAASSSAGRDPAVVAAEAALAAAKARYADSHPDVAIARQNLEQAKQLAKSNTTKLPTDAIDQQIASLNSQISALQASKAQEMARVGAVVGAQSRAPQILEQIAQLQQRLEGLNNQYQDVSKKLMVATTNAKANDEQKGERLTVIDPPVAPDEPISPNRPFLMAGGLLSGLGLGLLAIFAIEMFAKPIRDVQAVRAVTGEAPLVVVPTIGARQQGSKRGSGGFRLPFLGRKKATHGVPQEMEL